MPSVDERLEQVTAKIQRARWHILELQAATAAFMGSNPYGVATKVQPDTQRLVYYLDRVTATPSLLALIAGDAIQNMVTALDHRAYQVVCSDTNDSPPRPRNIYFPIARDAATYHRDKARKLEGAAAASVAAFDALLPYRGGDDVLWTLQELNNLDKHRLLITVGSHLVAVDIARIGLQQMRGQVPDAMMRLMENLEAFIRPLDTGFPLAPGSELLIMLPGDEPDPKQKFRFDVALHEPGILESASLLNTLNQYCSHVETVVRALTPRLAATS